MKTQRLVFWLWLVLGVFTDCRKGWAKRRRVINWLGRRRAICLLRLSPCKAGWFLSAGRWICIGVWRPAWWLIRWPFGIGLAHADPDDQPKTVYTEAIALFGLTLTSAVALTLSQQNATRPPSLPTLGLFGLVSLLIAGGLVFILRAQRRMRLCYERGSIMFTRWMLLGCVATAASFVGFAWIGLLPGQEFAHQKQAELGFPQDFSPTSKGGKGGLFVPLTLSRSTYPKGIPQQVRMEITTAAQLNKHWEVTEVDGEVDTDGKPTRMRPRPALSAEQEPGKWLVLLEDLSPTGKYHLKIYLQQRGDGKASVEEARILIQDKQGMKVTFTSKTAP